MYYHSELKIKVVYSKNNLRAPTKDGTYMLNLDDYKSLETHWIDLHANGNSMASFDSFGVKHIPEKIWLHQRAGNH